jgi:hypothetical protein
MSPAVFCFRLLTGINSRSHVTIVVAHTVCY